MHRISKKIFLHSKPFFNLRFKRNFSSSNNNVYPPKLFGELSDEPLDIQLQSVQETVSPAICIIGDVKCLISPMKPSQVAGNEDYTINTNQKSPINEPLPVFPVPLKNELRSYKTQDCVVNSSALKMQISNESLDITKPVTETAASSIKTNHEQGQTAPLTIHPVPAKRECKSKTHQDDVFKSRGIAVHMPARLRNPDFAKYKKTDGIPATNIEIGGDIRILDFQRNFPTKY